ncbi:hypothetical protein SESBI_43739 [Sesbania bispinosa]|nr:hypothetical protein SESBI_43739 [Sesbania bispinosa]
MKGPHRRPLRGVSKKQPAGLGQNVLPGDASQPFDKEMARSGPLGESTIRVLPFPSPKVVSQPLDEEMARSAPLGESTICVLPFPSPKIHSDTLDPSTSIHARSQPSDASFIRVTTQPYSNLEDKVSTEEGDPLFILILILRMSSSPEILSILKEAEQSIITTLPLQCHHMLWMTVNSLMAPCLMAQKKPLQIPYA